MSYVVVTNETLRGKGTSLDPLGVDSDRVGLPRSAFATLDLTIYARPTGSDDTGDGTLGNPYLTTQRSLRDVQAIRPSGTIVTIDCTDTDETFPPMWECPVFVASEGIGDFDFDAPFFYYYAAVNIVATPRMATGVAGILTIPFAGAVVTVPKANTNLIAIQSPGAGWTPGQLVGKFAIGAMASAAPGTEHSVIRANTADTIYVTRNSAPTFPITIRECSARWRAEKDPADLHRAAINFRNTPVMLGGIDIASLSSADGPFGGWGLQMGGNTPPTALQLCHVKGAGLVGSSWVRARQCHLEDSLFLMAPLALTQCYVDGSMEVVPTGPRVTVWGARGMDNLIRQTVIEQTTPLHFRDLFDNFSSAPVGLLELQDVEIVDTLTEFPPGNEGPIDDGILWTGCQLRALGVDVSRSIAGPGSAIRVKGNAASATLHGVTGANYDLGVKVEDGGNVEIDDAGGAATAITGAAGAFQSGSLAIEPAWMAPVYPAAGSNFPDYAGANAQGARVWRKS